MKPKKIDNSQHDLFRNRLSNQLNPRHEMFVLSGQLPWATLEKEFADLHVNDACGQPPKPVRLMVGLLLLQHMHNLSDDAVVRAWVENPYWQYFCGYDFIQWDLPIDSSSLTNWRKRLGSQRMEKILSLTVQLAVDTGTVKAKDLEKVIVDTTVMPKNISFPTDSKLQNRSRIRLVKLAKKHGIALRQNYNHEAKALLVKINNYLHAKQMKRAKGSMKRMKTILGRVARDCERRIGDNDALKDIFVQELQMAHHLYFRSKDTKKKIYSLHEPHVDCISKGKAHKKYEFGSKVALSITHQKGRAITTSCQAIAGNPFDGHTLASSLSMSEATTQRKVKEAYVDRGYKGHGVADCEVYISGQKRGITKKIRKDIKRRQAIEPHIGHLKQKVRLGLCRLKGIAGDQANAILSASAYNLRQIILHIRNIFAKILWTILSFLKLPVESLQPF
jgi:IS5 family transposase